LSRDTWAEDGVAGGDGADRLHHLMGGRILEQEAACPRAQRVDDVVVEPERGDDQHPLTGKSPRRLDAVHLWHADVHEHDIGCVVSRRAYRLFTRARLGDDLDGSRGLEHGLEAGPHHRLVVGDHDPQLAHREASP
jgi:hypothetical protein